MYDDGMHQDSLAADGIFGGFWSVLTDEEFYSINIMTQSLDSGYYNIVNNSAQFTSVGPVVFSHYKITTPDTIPNPGDVLKFQFTIKNESTTDTVYNITSKLSALDTCSSPLAAVIPMYGNIAPNEISLGDREQFIRFSTNCTDSVFAKIKIELFSEGSLFWVDTMSVFITKNPTSVETTKENIPMEFNLKQNYPNPFNPTTQIEFSIPNSSFVNLNIYNVLGKEIETLVADNLNAGKYTYNWNASEYASGVYFYKLQSTEFSEILKMVLLR